MVNVKVGDVRIRRLDDDLVVQVDANRMNVESELGNASRGEEARWFGDAPEPIDELSVQLPDRIMHCVEYG